MKALLIAGAQTALLVSLIATVGCGEHGGSAAPTSSLPAATYGDVSGSYTITSSTKPEGGPPYQGTATIAKVGGTYTLDWNIAKSLPYRGVAIPTGDLLAVGWGMGPAYGVVVYKVAGGKLSGSWATAATAGAVGSENLEGPPGASGTYKITSAMSPGSGKSYSGTVVIQQRGDVRSVDWKISDGSGYSGVGILEGDTLVVGWGTAGKGAGVVLYKVGTPTLNGKWAIPGGSGQGTEVLTKK